MKPPRPGPHDPAPYQDVRTALQMMLDAKGVKHFTAAEMLTLGAAHKRTGKNTLPPFHILSNIVKTAVLADAIREEVGRPLAVLSGYRSPAHNKAIGGAEASRHMWFQALDLSCRDVPAGELFRIADKLAKWKRLQCGIGLYEWGIHIDTGWHDRRW